MTRRILINRRDEFSYPKNSINIRRMAIKKLALFYNRIDDKISVKKNINISNTLDKKIKEEA